MFYTQRQGGELAGLDGPHHHHGGRGPGWRPPTGLWPQYYPLYYTGDWDTSGFDFLQSNSPCTQRKSTGEWVQLLNGEYVLCGPSAKPKPMAGLGALFHGLSSGLAGLAEEFDAYTSYLLHNQATGAATPEVGRTGSFKDAADQADRITQQRADEDARRAQEEADRQAQVQQELPGMDTVLPTSSDPLIQANIDIQAAIQDANKYFPKAGAGASPAWYVQQEINKMSNENAGQLVGDCSDPTYKYWHAEECA